MKNIKFIICSCVVILIFISTSIVQAGSVEGKVTYKKKKYLPNTVIYIDSVKGDFEIPKENPVIDQKNMVFHPHVLPVLAGTTVDFLNSDDVAHNVFTPDKSADKFNLGTWPKGEIRSFKFEKRCDNVCDAVMLCNVHPEMESYVVVMQNPYFALADDEGNFKINNIPAGTYLLKIWNPKLKSEGQEIVVSKDGTVEISIPMKK